MRGLYFTSVLLVALALVPGAAHVLELPNKIGLPAQEYLTVQQIYRGWAWLGVLLVAALACTFTLAIRTRPVRVAHRFAWLAFSCLAAQLGVFFALTYPVNRATENWSLLPSGWEALRTRWEYSHAASALLVLVALIAVIGSLLAFLEDAQVPRGMRRS